MGDNWSKNRKKRLWKVLGDGSEVPIFFRSISEDYPLPTPLILVAGLNCAPRKLKRQVIIFKNGQKNFQNVFFVKVALT